MGWCSGSGLAESVWDLFEEYVDIVRYDDGEEVAKAAINLVYLFESRDCDTMDECEFIQKLLSKNMFFIAYYIENNAFFSNPSDDEIKEEIEEFFKCREQEVSLDDIERVFHIIKVELHRKK